jgi:hypothetical protein
MANKDNSKTTSLDAMTFGDVKGARIGSSAPPSWVPHFAEIEEKDRSTLMASLGAGSTFRPDLLGTLGVGDFEPRVGLKTRKMYFVDVKTGDGTTRVLLPEHALLWSTLAYVKPGDTVKMVYTGRRQGRGNNDKTKSNPRANGKSAPHTYDVTCANALDKPRADALTVSSGNGGGAGNGSEGAQYPDEG